MLKTKVEKMQQVEPKMPRTRHVSLPEDVQMKLLRMCVVESEERGDLVNISEMVKLCVVERYQRLYEGQFQKMPVRL